MVVLTSESGALGHTPELFLEAKSKNDYIEKLDYLKDENIRNEIGKKLRTNISKDYNADKETSKLIKLYGELLND